MELSRAERLISNSEGLDAIVIVNDTLPFTDSTFWYLTELNGGSFESSLLIVRKDGSMDVITNALEAETASAGKGNILVYKKYEEREQFLKDALKGCVKVGFNVNSASYAAVNYVKKAVKGVKIADASKAIASTVTVKDKKEIELTKKACKISSKVAKEIPEMLSAGMTEKEMAFRIDVRMRELGGTGNAFDTISAFGANSSKPHHSPTDYKLKKGDAALFDFGTKYELYCSDMTRTVFLSKPPEIMVRAYEVVKEAQDAGIEKYKDGLPAKEADLAAREVIDKTEFKGKFIHSFGHGIGMDVHQDISVSPRSKDILKEGNVVSAEPGIYIPGVGGIRIEDTCLITKKGCERLTDFDRRLTII